MSSPHVYGAIKPASGLAMAEAIGQITRLKSLDVGDCLVKNTATLALLEALRKHTSLEVLDLSYNECDAQSLNGFLATVGTSLTLRRLEINGNIFSEVSEGTPGASAARRARLTNWRFRLPLGRH